MVALVVYESVFGNTRVVAEAVAKGLGPQVELLEVDRAPDRIDADVDLLVVGGPTHAFGMTRASTRQDAAKQAGRLLVADRTGIREWLDLLPAVDRPVDAATFDTRVKRPRVPGSAARAAQRRLRHLGFRIVRPATSFWVRGKEGPLHDGEQERAVAWGADLAARHRRGGSGS